jgi:hypothetical protein
VWPSQKRVGDTVTTEDDESSTPHIMVTALQVLQVASIRKTLCDKFDLVPKESIPLYRGLVSHWSPFEINRMIATKFLLEFPDDLSEYILSLDVSTGRLDLISDLLEVPFVPLLQQAVQ